jgi:tetratricopeptide (TPR) repeat protein
VAAYGLDVLGPGPGAVAAAIRKERPAVRLALIEALEYWAVCARDRVRTPRLWQVAGLADDDGWRRRLRAAVAGGDLGALRRLAGEARGQPLPAVSLELLAAALRGRGARADAVALLRDARGRHPADFWIHFQLGKSLHDPLHPDPATLDEALGCYWAAVALRPGSAPAHTNLGAALQARGRLDEAIAEYRKAIDLAPKFAPAHFDLGVALQAKGRVDEAVAEYRKAIDLDPRYAPAHFTLGNALAAKGRLDEAIAEYRQAIALDPKYASAHYNLGLALQGKGRLDGAIAEYQKAIDLEPKYAPAHGALGQALLKQGRFTEARDATRRALGLLPERDPLRARVAQQFQTCGRLLALDEKLPAFIKDDTQPADNRERLLLADLCQRYRKRHAAAVRFFTDAFAAEPKLADDLNQQHRYNAACSAALAAAGMGEDAGRLPDRVILTLRRQALRWLRADLAAYAKLAERDDPNLKQAVRQRLTHWLKDADLASVRDKDALNTLPDHERQEWGKLWEEVAALLKKADGKKPDEATRGGRP